jgi:hypothetical protein
VGARDGARLNGARVDSQRVDVFYYGSSQGEMTGEVMRNITLSLLAIATALFVTTAAASAAPLSSTAMCRAAAKTSLVSKAHCRIVRRCSYWGCSYEEVCN